MIVSKDFRILSDIHRRYILILSILFFVTPIMSQSAFIEVKDAESNVSIPDVTIVFKSLTSGKKHYASTNNLGIVKNTLKESSRVEVSYTGYKTLVDTISPNTSRTYFLEVDIFNLDQVVVTATRTRKVLKNAPVLTQVISAKQIESRGFQNVTDILSSDIPNIEIQQHGYGANLNAQGLEPENILILIDGERLAGETRSNVDYSRLNAQEIDHIEIVKGAASALYGSQAMGAVVNIITKKSNKKLYASASTQYTNTYEKNYPNLTNQSDDYSVKKNLDRSNLTQNYTVGFNLGKWQGKTNYNQKTKDAYQLYDTSALEQDYYELGVVVNNPIDLNPKNVFGLKDYTISQSLKYTANQKLSLKINGSYYQHDQYDFLFDNKHDQYEDLSFTLKANYTPNSKSNYSLSVHDDTYNKYDYSEPLEKGTIKYRHHYTNPKLTGSFQLNEKQHFTAGVEYLKESLLSDQFIEDELSTRKVSNGVIFLQDDIKISEKWNSVLGIRADYHTSFGVHYSPKVSVMYKNYPVTVRTNYASGYRSPSLKELYTDWNLLGMFTIKGSADLLPETNQYVATSFEFSNSKINTSVSTYYNSFKNKIEGLWYENQTIYQYKNTSSTKLLGIDYLVQYQPSKSWYIKGAYSYVKEMRGEGIRISNSSPHTGSLQVSYNYQLKNYSLNASISGKYIGAKNNYGIDTIDYQGELIEANYMINYDGYSIWRLSLQQKFNQYIDITLGINNLFDYTPKVFTFNTSISPGRTYFTGVKIDFEQLFNNQF